MQIKIINKTNWENVYAKLYRKCRRTNVVIKLEFMNNECLLDVDLNKYRYLFLQNDNIITKQTIRTEIIILSQNLDTISLEYNPNKECYDAYLINKDVTSYEQVES